MGLDIVSLARFQFGMTTVFHFFFVPFSIGLALMVAIMETLYVRKKDEIYKKMAKFWGNIFLLSFAVGVVTGIIQEFQFGMNWSEYSRFVGDIFGAPLAIEALAAFFMESTFLGLWIFTWDRFKPKHHVIFIWLVAFGSTLSALWILAANSFMQHPVGYVMNNGKGRAELNDFGALLANHQVWYEFGHVVFGAFLLGGMVVAGLSAFRLLKKSSPEFYKKSMRIGLIVGLISSICVIGIGDLQMKALIEDQPMKFAAMEAAYEDTGENAAWTLVGGQDTKNHKSTWTVKIPYMLGILAGTSDSMDGMNKVNANMIAQYGSKDRAGNKIDYYPSVRALFWNFRFMAGFGGLMFLVSALGLFFTRKKKASLYDSKWMLWVVGLTTFAPFIANTSGWLITELGRFPWTVYGVFTIQESVSPNVSTTSLLISNIVYFLIFCSLGGVMVFLTIKELQKGPDYEAKQLAKLGKDTDPFDKEVFE